MARLVVPGAWSIISIWGGVRTAGKFQLFPQGLDKDTHQPCAERVKVGVGIRRRRLVERVRGREQVVAHEGMAILGVF